MAGQVAGSISMISAGFRGKLLKLDLGPREGLSKPHHPWSRNNLVVEELAEWAIRKLRRKSRLATRPMRAQIIRGCVRHTRRSVSNCRDPRTIEFITEGEADVPTPYHPTASEHPEQRWRDGKLTRLASGESRMPFRKPALFRIELTMGRLMTSGAVHCGEHSPTKSELQEPGLVSEIEPGLVSDGSSRRPSMSRSFD